MAPPPKTKAERKLHESYTAYKLGWFDGAAYTPRRAMIFMLHEKAHIRRAYIRGYVDGELASDKMKRDGAQHYDIDLESAVLR